jgi:hypothetical protein
VCRSKKRFSQSLPVSMQRMDKVSIVAEKVYIRGYQTAKNVYFEANIFFTLKQKMFPFLKKKFTTFIKKMPKGSPNVNQCKPR